MGKTKRCYEPLSATLFIIPVVDGLMDSTMRERQSRLEVEAAPSPPPPTTPLPPWLCPIEEKEWGRILLCFICKVDIMVKIGYCELYFGGGGGGGGGGRKWKGKVTVFLFLINAAA